MKNKTYYAEQWFKLQEIPTTYKEKENTIFVIVGANFEVELSEEEINYRAELFLESEIQGLNTEKITNFEFDEEGNNCFA